MFKKILAFKKYSGGLLLLLLTALPLIAAEGNDPTRPMTSQVATSITGDPSDKETTDTAEKPLRLYQIIQSKHGNKALINGKMLQVNDKIKNYTVSKIDAYEVSLLDDISKNNLVISIFNQKELSSPPPAGSSNNTKKNNTSTADTDASSNKKATADVMNDTLLKATSSAVLPPEAAILNALDINKINLDQLLKPLQGSKP